jgi:hypothetical protein
MPIHRGIEVGRMHPIRFVRRWPVVGIAYTAMLVGGYIWWILQPPARRAWVLAASSTNIVHLEHVPWRVLPASSIWSGDPIGWWVVATLLCLGALEMVRGPVVTIVTGLVAHVVGTLVSEGVLAIRIAAGELSSSGRQLLDVGPSYVVASCAAAVIASPRAPRALRIGCAVTIVPLYVAAFDFTDDGQVATIGHAVALTVGALIARSKWFRSHQLHWPHLGDLVDLRRAVFQR